MLRDEVLRGEVLRGEVLRGEVGSGCSEYEQRSSAARSWLGIGLGMR